MPDSKFTVKNLYKIFGDEPDKALSMLQQGIDKDNIFEQTGQTVGVKDASFDVHEGEIFVIMGLSGSGKSTLVRLLNRLIEPSAGQVLIEDQDVTAMDERQLRQLRREKMSMVFQSFALMPHMDVLDNASFGLMLNKVGKHEREARAMEALKQVGLEPYAHSYPAELSGGMQQRVGLARALANDPDILLMDEAFSALDPLIRTEMQDELLKLQSENKRTIVFISHDLDEAIRIGDRIAIMQGGEIVQIGTPEQILNEPANDYVASFFRGVSTGDICQAGHLAKQNIFSITRKGDLPLSEVSRRLKEADKDYGYILSEDNHYLGTVTQESINQADASSQPLESAFIDKVQAVDEQTTVNELITPVAASPYPVPVENEQHEFVGVVSKTNLLQALNTQGDDEHATGMGTTEGDATIQTRGDKS